MAAQIIYNKDTSYTLQTNNYLRPNPYLRPKGQGGKCIYNGPFGNFENKL